MLNGKTLKAAVIAATLTGIVCVAGGFAAAGSANVKSDQVEGKVRLKRYADPFDERRNHIIECGETLEIVVELHVDEFFGRNTVMASPKATNPTSEPKYFSFNIAFYDSRGNLLGCASQSSGSTVDPNGGTLQLGSCYVSLEPEEIEMIRSYQVRVYESNKEVGSGRLMAAH